MKSYRQSARIELEKQTLIEYNKLRNLEDVKGKLQSRLCQRSRVEAKRNNLIFNDYKLKQLIEVKMSLDKAEEGESKRKSLRKEFPAIPHQKAKSLALLKL